MLQILIRFRSHHIVVTGDIERAFHTIMVSDGDRDYLRFLWVDDIHAEQFKITGFRFCRIPFGLNCSPFLLNATIRYHLQHVPDKQVNCKRILENLYVDDFVSGARSVDSAFELFHNTRELLKGAGMNLRKWVTNSPTLLSRLNSLNVSPSGSKQLQPTEAKVLGVYWDSQNDVLFFRLDCLQDLASRLPVTKRTVLRIAASDYDPLGLLAPIMVRIKFLC